MERSGSEGERRQYHHGDLRRALLAATAEMIVESGPAAVNLRELARRVGVSHAAPQHHFGDKAGLLTALALEGYQLLGGALERAGPDLLDVGVAYVRFAVGHPAHFTVMFQPGLYHADRPEMLAARTRTRRLLDRALDRPDGGRGAGGPAGTGGRAAATTAATAAWSIVHGFATLWLSGAIGPRTVPGGSDDAGDAARDVIRLLFPDR